MITELDADLLELFAFMNTPIASGGFHTWPGRDENNDKIFADCVELERIGYLSRLINEPDHVCFKVVADVK